MKPILEALKWLFQNLYHVAEDAITIAKKYSAMYLKALVWLFIVAASAPIPFLVFGVILDWRWLIAISGLLWAVFIFALLVLVAPLGILIEIVLGGPKGSGLRYLKAASSVLLFELCFSFFGSLLPMGKNLSTVPLLIIGAIILSLLNAWIFRREIIGLIVGTIFLCVILSFYFPVTFSNLGERITDLDFYLSKPRQVKMSLQSIQQGSVEFFKPDGQPRFWYYLRNDGRIELFDNSGFHPVHRQELRPITPDIVTELERELVVADSLRSLTESRTTPMIPSNEQKSVTKPRQQHRSQEQSVRSTETRPRTLLTETTPPLSPGMKLAFTNKRVTFWVGFPWPQSYEVAVQSIELLQNMDVFVTLTIENTGSQTARIALAEPDSYSYIVDETGAKYAFLDSKDFPQELPSGIPFRFTLLFNNVPTTTQALFIYFRCAPVENHSGRFKANLDRTTDVVIRDLRLK